MRAFAAPERAGCPHGRLRSLAAQHVVALDEHGGVLMAHPFANHTDGARVDAGGRTWWGNCAWDAFGIVAALDLRDATITAQGITLRPATTTPSSTCSSPPATGGTTSASPERRCGSSGPGAR